MEEEKKEKDISMERLYDNPFAPVKEENHKPQSNIYNEFKKQFTLRNEENIDALSPTNYYQ